MLLFCDIIIINVLHENQRINAILISDFLHLQKQQQQQQKNQQQQRQQKTDFRKT